MCIEVVSGLGLAYFGNVQLKATMGMLLVILVIIAWATWFDIIL